MITFFEILNSGIPAQPACQQFYFAILHIFNINSDSKFSCAEYWRPTGIALGSGNAADNDVDSRYEIGKHA
jgi:hypothetical protein